MRDCLKAIGMGCIVALGAGSAHALSLDGSGNVTNWNNLAPLGQTGGSDVVDSGAGITSFRQNNWAPGHLDTEIPELPNGHNLSFDPQGGERFDLEEIHIRVNAINSNALDILIVSSGEEDNGGSPDDYKVDSWSLGDFFVNWDGDDTNGLVDGDGSLKTTGAGAGVDPKGGQGATGFDHALIMNMNRVGVDADRVMGAGEVYEAENDMSLQSGGSGGFDGDDNEFYLTPWALDAANNTSKVTGQKFVPTSASFDYGTPHGVNETSGSGDRDTWLYETGLDFSPAALGGGLTPGQKIDFHIAWGCGNDIFKGTYMVPGGPGPGGGFPGGSGVPEPATLGLGLLALGGLFSKTARRRSWA